MKQNAYFLLLCIGGLVALTGCDEAKKAAGDCDAELTAKVESLQAAAKALGTVSADLKVDVFAACNNINKDLEADEVTAADGDAPTDDEVEEACANATAAINAEIDAGATITVVVEGGRCSVDAEAQLDCEASCSVEGECNPGTLEARCTPGELSVSCEGECSANAYCEADVAIECTGTCEGTCEGECSGSCSGTAECTGTCEGTCMGDCSGTCSTMNGNDCAGECTGTCTGTCKGSCSASASCEGECAATCDGTCKGSCKLEAAAECGVDARCKGECTGTATAPKCEAELTPPSCDLDADCQAGCDGQAKFKAECTPPTVSVVVTGTASAGLDATLEANLPALLAVVEQAELVGSAAVDVGGAFGEAGAAVVDAGISCTAQFGADLTAAIEASVKASASFSVSVMASASVSGSAMGSTN